MLIWRPDAAYGNDLFDNSHFPVFSPQLLIEYELFGMDYSWHGGVVSGLGAARVRRRMQCLH